MRGKLILVGSGEFTPAMDDVDREVLASLGRPRARVAIVPTASGEEETPQSWTDMAATHFAALGAEAYPVMVLHRDDANDPRWSQALSGTDLIYFSGGKPGYAIETLAGTPFWDRVVRCFREGAYLAGSSAGAMILGERSYAPDDFDENGMPRKIAMRAGLGLLPGLFVIPHFDLLSSFPPERIAAWLALWPAGDRCLAIDENTALIEGAHGWSVRGTGRVLTMRSFDDRDVHLRGARLDGIRVAV